MTNIFQPRFIATMLAMVLVPSALAADTVEGQVTKVDASMSVTITLPAGVAVAPGDPVQIIGNIPGVGPVAISTKWKVDSFSNGIATATPQSTPTGTPQKGYSAKIDTNAVAVVETDPQGQSAEGMSMYLAAQEMVRAGDLVNAANLYQQAAELGYVEAMTELGVIYSFGRGKPQNDASALKWQTRAADLGNVMAMLRLGLIHKAGWGVAVSNEIATSWFLRAAELGDTFAMLYVFDAYEDGRGVPKDFSKAVIWLKKSADHGNTLAQFFMGAAYIDGEDGIIPKDIGLAEKYLLSSANAGNQYAMQMLVELYQDEKNDPAAADHWSRAANDARPAAEYMMNPRCLGPDECYEER